MSATALSRSGNASRQLEPLGLRAAFVGVGLATVCALIAGIALEWDAISVSLTTLLLWIAVAAAGDLMPVSLWGSVTLSMSLPVTLAAGMVLSPVQAGLVAFVAALDVREFRSEVTLARGLYNRSQVAISVVLASLAFQGLGGNVLDWPFVLVVGLGALVVDWIANSVLVLVPMSMMTHVPARTVLMRVYGRSPLKHMAGYVCLGLLAVLLGTVWVAVGGWGLVSFLIPLGLARQMFSQERELEEADSKIEAKNRALVAAAGQTLVERRDERMAVAGELHDEVLPPLFKVHLMGQVLRQDLNSGRLLDLDDDIPELIVATEAAQEAVRCVLRDLRRSSLGPGGLNSTIELFSKQLDSAGAPRIHLLLEDVGGSSLIQLVAYQVAREAMNNAARHSRASEITVSLRRQDGLIRLTVEDDGIGFIADEIDAEAHFGLQLIRERVESAGGTVYLDSKLGIGTRLIVRLPPDVL
jgi:signal transduction histidine kinase